jgi:hypothetical protein
MLECLDEVIADCLHYYGVDITEMSGHRAIPLVANLSCYWSVIPDADPMIVRSAVHPILETLRREADEQDESKLLNLEDIAGFGGEYRKG